MIEILTEDEKKLRALKKQMNNEVVMYCEEWFVLQKKYKKLFDKIEKAKGTR